LSRSECYSPCHYTTHRSGTQPAACMHGWTIQPASLPACLPHLRARRRRQPQREPSSGYAMAHSDTGPSGSPAVSECRSVEQCRGSVGAVSGQCRGSVRAVSGQCRLTLVSECRAVSEQCQSSVGQVVYSLSIQPAALQTLWGALEAPVSRIGESGTTGPLRPAHPAPHTLTYWRSEGGA